MGPVARVTRQVDVAHAAPAEDGFELIRTDHQADGDALQELLRLEARELAALDEVLGNPAGVGTGVERHGAQRRLELLASQQPAAQDRSYERINLGGHRRLWRYQQARRLEDSPGAWAIVSLALALIR